MAGFSSRYMTMSTSPRSPQRLPYYVDFDSTVAKLKDYRKETNL